MLEHNAKTLEEAEKYICQGKDFCIVNPCGSGKTSVMAGIIRNHPDKSFVIFTKQKNAKRYYREKDDVFKNVCIQTYARMLIDYKNGNTAPYDADIYICDEAHYLGAEKWGEAFAAFREMYHPLSIGVTATAQRFLQQGTAESVVSDLFSGNSVGNYTASMLQKSGVFQEPKYVLGVWSIQDTITNLVDKVSQCPDNVTIRYTERLWEMADRWEKEARPEVVLKELIPFMYKSSCNRILVYNSNVTDLKKKMCTLTSMIRDVFPGRKVEAYSYTHKDPEENLIKFQKNEKGTYIKILYSVDKIMETVHIDDLNIAIMLRPSVSNRIIIQQFGRLNSIGNSHKPLIIDMVDNLSKLGSVDFDQYDSALYEKSEKHSGGESDASDKKKSLYINVNFLFGMKKLFDAVDAASKRVPHYTIDGYTGTLKQICEIYDCPIPDFVEKCISEGDDIEDAIIRASEFFKQTYGAEKRWNYSQNTFDGFVLRQQFPAPNKQLVEKYIPYVQNFIKTKNITNEDMIQELYLDMMEVVSYHKTRILSHIYLRLRKRYVLMRRMEARRKDMFEDNLERLIEKDCVAEICASDSTKTFLLDLMDKTLKDKEKEVLKYLVWHNENIKDACRYFHTTKGNVLLIKNQALRKMSQYVKKEGEDLADMLECMNDISNARSWR